MKRNNNEGNIRERKDGRFEVRVTAGYDFETGKSKRISYYAKTKTEAVKKLHEEEYKIHFKLNNQGMSPKTISNLHRCLHKALNQAVLEHYLDFNPCDAVNLPRNEKLQIEILTREEQQRLIYTSYNFRYGFFIRLTLATGIRLGELLGLRWEDIDYQKSMYPPAPTPVSELTVNQNEFILMVNT